MSDLTPVERLIGAVFFGTDDPVDAPHIVVADDPESGLTFWGPFPDEVTALAALERTRRHFAEADLFGIVTSIARLLPASETED